jgi:hypothetical protein
MLERKARKARKAILGQVFYVQFFFAVFARFALNVTFSQKP